MKEKYCSRRKMKKVIAGLVAVGMCLLAFLYIMPQQPVFAAPVESNQADGGLADDTAGTGLSFYFSIGEGGSLTSVLQMLLILTIITIAPSILIMVTSFTRIIVVLHFARTALGMQTTPPNQVLVGLALFLTVFIMSPVFSEINTEAIQPLSANEITQEEAFERGLKPVREFMFNQTDSKDLKLFLRIAGYSSLESKDDCPTSVLIPAFIISELRMAFIIGFCIYIPFIIIDMVVASTLMSMGMMMLPPTTISMPFKILLFLMADGWNLIIEQVIGTFRL